MDKLETLIRNLEQETDVEKQVQILQRINAELLNNYYIVADGIKVEPLLLEIYYYDSAKFADENTHKSNYQQNRFGKLYFHEKGRGGVDIVLSKGDYYLSVLIKYSLVNEEFTKQIALYDKLKGINEFVLKERDNSANGKIAHFMRKDMQQKSFANEKLAALPIDKLKKYPFTLSKGNGKAKLLEMYMEEHPEYNNLNNWKSLLGWIPKAVREKLDKESAL